MFGEYALYSDGKVVALVCENSLFAKATDAGREFIGDVVEAAPYPGAIMSFPIEYDFDNGDWPAELIDRTEAALPMPKPRRRKTSKTGRSDP